MKEKVAVATIQGKAYFKIVNALKEQNIAFNSIIPGTTIPPRIKIVITTEQEKEKVKFRKVLTFNGETELDCLIIEVKKLLLGKESYEKIIVGIDPGGAIGLVVMAEGKVIEEGNCYCNHEVVNVILKVIKTIDFSVTNVIVKIGNGVPVYKELLKELDNKLPPQVVLEVVSEAGTSYPKREHTQSRKVRHISSAKCIAGRTGKIVDRNWVVKDTDK
ncbi:MAG: hypothetical protein GX648_02505 [Crenarchaeota archaeon]|nr:hypothetical protein [Thermoproteota archaeon]